MAKSKAPELRPTKRKGVGGRIVTKDPKRRQQGKKTGARNLQKARRAAAKPQANKLRAKTRALRDGQKVWRDRGAYKVEFVKRKGVLVETGNRKSPHTGAYKLGSSGRGRHSKAKVHRGIVRR